MGGKDGGLLQGISCSYARKKSLFYVAENIFKKKGSLYEGDLETISQESIKKAYVRYVPRTVHAHVMSCSDVLCSQAGSSAALLQVDEWVLAAAVK